MNNPHSSLSPTGSSSTPVHLGVRKRVASNESLGAIVSSKKQRTSHADENKALEPNSVLPPPLFPACLTHSLENIREDLVRLRRAALPIDDIYDPHFSASPRPRISRSSSVSGSANRRFLALASERLEPTMSELLALSEMKSKPEPEPEPETFLPEASAAKWLKNITWSVDYLPPSTSKKVSARLLTCAGNNILYFTRGDCVYFKNLCRPATDDAEQLCEFKSKEEGHVRALASNVGSRSNIVAIGTSKGHIQLWDVNTKKMITDWKAVRNISAMVWNRDILTIGNAQGEIQSYDTKLPTYRIRFDCKSLTHHKAQITSLVWSESGCYLASGDASGIVLCWDRSLTLPMEVGEYIQDQRKMVHQSSISALAWCPWKPTQLVTADVGGVVRIWDIHRLPIGIREPARIETRGMITSMHFSPTSACPELLITHGARVTTSSCYVSVRLENSISVFEYPTFRPRAIFRPDTNSELEMSIGDSVLDESRTKLIYATPENKRLNIANIWKKKEVKKAQSMSLLDITKCDARRFFRQI